MPSPYDLFDYQKYWQGREYEDQAEKLALKKLLSLMGKQPSLVDIGSGFGRLTPAYLDFAEKIVLVDPSANNLSVAEKKLGHLDKITYEKGSFPDLPLAASSFAAVVMIRVIHHLADSQKAIKEVARVLKPGGYLLLEFANKTHFLARIKAIMRGELNFASDLRPLEQRSKESIKQKKILFLNHHPQKILADLQNNNLQVISILSVSNFRNPIMKKILPLKILLFLEDICQTGLSHLYFGPSIFILARKSHNT